MSQPAQPSWRPASAPSRDPIVPWAVKAEHRWARPLAMLRIESRRRAGFHVPGGDLEQLSRFRAELAARGLVVHYESRTEQGWWLVPRRPGIDAGLIREPIAAQDGAGRPRTSRAARGWTALCARVASMIRMRGSGSLRRPRKGGLRAGFPSSFGGAGALLSVRRGPIAGTWRAYLDRTQQPPRRRLLRAVRQATRQYEIGWETGPFIDVSGLLYFDASPRRGSDEVGLAVRQSNVDRH